MDAAGTRADEAPPTTPAVPAQSRLGSRRRFFALFVLAFVGFALGWIFRDPLLRAAWAVFPPSDETWDRWVREDATSLLSVVAPDPRLPEQLPADFREAWERRRSLYSPERRDDLRRRLDGYLDFLEAEHADCREIFRAGLREDVRSDAATEARRRLAADFGTFAETLVRQADEQREEAFRASPKTAGYDPDGRDFVEAYEDLRNWMPRARARVVELTSNP